MKVTIVAFFVLVTISEMAYGSGGEKNRSVRNDHYTFSYPGSWREINVTGAPTAADSVASVGPKPFNGAELVQVSVQQTAVPITQANLQEAKRQLAALYARTYGSVTKGPTSTVFHK